MKNAFSLLEVIVVLVIVSALTTFIVSKSETSIDLALKTKIKSEIALIRTSISKIKTKNILLNNDNSISLDNASLNVAGNELFSEVLDFPLISTSEEKKESGKWIKVSANEYIVYLADEKKLTYNFTDNFFVCNSELSICKEYE